MTSNDSNHSAILDQILAHKNEIRWFKVSSHTREGILKTLKISLGYVRYDTYKIKLSNCGSISLELPDEFPKNDQEGLWMLAEKAVAEIFLEDLVGDSKIAEQDLPFIVK